MEWFKLWVLVSPPFKILLKGSKLRNSLYYLCLLFQSRKWSRVGNLQLLSLSTSQPLTLMTTWRKTNSLMWTMKPGGAQFWFFWLFGTGVSSRLLSFLFDMTVAMIIDSLIKYRVFISPQSERSELGPFYCCPGALSGYCCVCVWEWLLLCVGKRLL